MKNTRLNILTYFLIIVFISPVFIQGLHDAFFHDYSHEFHHSKQLSFDKENHDICFIHGFKYNSFEFDPSIPDLFLQPKITYHYSSFKEYILNNNSHEYFLLRAPPVLV